MQRIVSYLFFCFCFACIVSCGHKKNEPKKDPGNTSRDTTSRFNIIENKINPYAVVDVSPMDISYFPVEYPILKMENRISTPPLARIVYSRPHLQGRRLFQNLLKLGETWRLGANESTELDLYTDANIQDKKIKAGRYVLYSIPQTDSWTIILNSNIDSWGLHPDSTKDIARFVIPVQKTNNLVEYYTMIFEKTKDGAAILMAWDDLEARLPISFN